MDLKFDESPGNVLASCSEGCVKKRNNPSMKANVYAIRIWNEITAFWTDLWCCSRPCVGVAIWVLKTLIGKGVNKEICMRCTELGNVLLHAIVKWRYLPRFPECLVAELTQKQDRFTSKIWSLIYSKAGLIFYFFTSHEHQMHLSRDLTNSWTKAQQLLLIQRLLSNHAYKFLLSRIVLNSQARIIVDEPKHDRPINASVCFTWSACSTPHRVCIHHLEYLSIYVWIVVIRFCSTENSTPMFDNDAVCWRKWSCSSFIIGAEQHLWIRYKYFTFVPIHYWSWMEE